MQRNWLLRFQIILAVSLWGAFCSSGVLAADSCNLFTSGAQSPGASGGLNIGGGATITGGATELQFVSITDNGANLSCGTVDCTATGSPSEASTFTYPTINYGSNNLSVSSGTLTSSDGTWNNVTVGTGATLEFTTVGGTYEMANLQINGTGTLKLAPGDYYVQNGINLNSGAAIEVTSGTARIFTSGTINWNSGTNLTGITTPESLFVWAASGMNLQTGAALNGYYYSPNSVYLSSNTVVTGAVAGGNQVQLSNNSGIVFDRRLDGQIRASVGTSCANGDGTWGR